MSEVDRYQTGFEAGLKVGLLTAKVVVRDAMPATYPLAKRIAETLNRHIAEIREVQDRRSGKIIPEMAVGDLFLATPLAHPGDLGIDATERDEWLVGLSHMRFAPPWPSRK